MNDIVHKSLLENGWTEFISGSTDAELISIASEFGKIIKHPNKQEVFILKPKLEKDANVGTFSHRHGLMDFPLHTDAAFYPKPARYVLMHSNQSNNCETTIIGKDIIWDLLSDLEKNIAERSIYLLKTKNSKYYTSLIFKFDNQNGIKYDPSCMIPFNKYAKDFDQVFKSVISQIEPVGIKWTKGKTLIFDNWKYLHGRKSAENDADRVLKRIYIN